MQAIWPPFLASLSDIFGRRLIYLFAGPLAIGSCVGLALAPTIACLIGLRVCQALSMSPLYSVGMLLLFLVPLPFFFFLGCISPITAKILPQL